MNKKCFVLVGLAATLFLAASVGFAQGNVKNGPDVMRDPEMEKESLHNLEAARLYFTLRKAYVASLQRCEEIIAGNPTFAKIDEVLYMAGKSSLNLAEGKGKQKPDQYVMHEGDKKITLTAAEFRDKARDYLSQLVNDYPQSKLKDKAMGDLSSLGGPKPKERTSHKRNHKYKAQSTKQTTRSSIPNSYFRF